ncbi:TfoX/Sxy family DNA transformation protein [Marinagarivorans cellulosilyticus]|uniref:DNA transformation protein and related proteins n=1 Tax=Marinagarivorans cellulosilyticus TaxID=2721545 RepID=A0AAN2BIJ5_9GAMM|nr:TfoX/Sxy family DNA transformation protein [Marinagarivorans cellulosilyticus]BCD95929.1 DNA transformation protein and related proteins [Marinagarivorans cellulosilyticus]
MDRIQVLQERKPVSRYRGKSAFLEMPLNGFGPRSEEILAEVEIHSVEDFMAIDPYDLYAKIKPMKGMGLNSIYAIIGARENLSWLEVAKTRKAEILMRLDDLRLAPK